VYAVVEPTAPTPITTILVLFVNDIEYKYYRKVNQLVSQKMMLNQVDKNFYGPRWIATIDLLLHLPRFFAIALLYVLFAIQQDLMVYCG